ncbi:MAG TPA: hypothetical protein DEP84_14485 [Chloroflexi bacterium]|nr:hypothetical protein [Chloroflexota bacterium]
MPFQIYRHSSIEALQESRAFYRVASLLHDHYHHHSRPSVVLVGNVPTLRHGLTQLDAILFSEKFVALLDFKSCSGPIEGLDPDQPWRVIGSDHVVRSGKAINPYRQIARARSAWIPFLANAAARLPRMAAPHRHQLERAWRHLNGWILFYPSLHRQSQIMYPQEDALWFNILSTDEVLAYSFKTVSTLQLTAEEMDWFATEALGASRWFEHERILDNVIGCLCVVDAEGKAIAYPISSFDEFTIGRGAHQRIRVRAECRAVSNDHARIKADGHSVRIIDVSRHGTLINGERIEKGREYLLEDGDRLVLGGNALLTCKLWFQTRWSGEDITPPTDEPTQ